MALYAPLYWYGQECDDQFPGLNLYLPAHSTEILPIPTDFFISAEAPEQPPSSPDFNPYQLVAEHLRIYATSYPSGYDDPYVAFESEAIVVEPSEPGHNPVAASNTEGGNYKCNQCDFLTRTYWSHKEHKRRHHPKPAICQHCNKTFNRPEDVKRHMKTSCRALSYCLAPVSCQYCKETFSRRDSLKRHMTSRCKLSPQPTLSLQPALSLQPTDPTGELSHNSTPADVKQAQRSKRKQKQK